MPPAGSIDLYAVDVEWWRGSGAVGYFRHELGFDYHGPGGLPDNWAFNTADGLYRRLVSSFISPLATAFMLVVALLLSGVALQSRRRRPLAVGLLALCSVGLLFTLSRSSLVAFAGGLVVLAIAARRWWPVAAAVIVLAAGVAYAYSFTSVAPRTHFFPADLPYQQEQARQHGGLPGGGSLALNPGEPSLRSHWRNLRDGIDTVLHHPQGYGLGNAGATASRFGVPLRAGESNYTETGVETGLLGALAVHRLEPCAALRARALGVGAGGRDDALGGGGRSGRARGDPRARHPDRRLRRALARVLPLVARRLAGRARGGTVRRVEPQLDPRVRIGHVHLKVADLDPT